MRLSDPELATPPPLLEEKFVENWLNALSESSGYEIRHPFALVPSIRGKKVAVCAPLLSYTHVDRDTAAALAQAERDANPQIRYLAQLDSEPASGAPVQAMLPLFPWESSADYWANGLRANMRKKLRKCEKDGLFIERRSDPHALEVFYKLFLETMHRHGTPPFSRRVFESFLKHLDSHIFFATSDGKVLAAYFVIYSARVALLQWVGMYQNVGYASLATEWKAIELAFEKGCDWFDLGRTAYLGAAYEHKSKWHPQLYAPVTLPQSSTTLYSKYRLASKAWKLLPSSLASTIGPALARRITDF